MSCKNVCRLCPNLVISTAVAFDGTSLNITIPDNGYRRGEKVCIVVAQAIPATTIISAPVNIVVGGSTFPLLRYNCTQATACEIRTRTRYSTCVVTNTTTGAFRLLGKTYPQCPETLDTLPVADVTALNNAVTPAVAPLRTTKKEVVTNE